MHYYAGIQYLMHNSLHVNTNHTANFSNNITRVHCIHIISSQGEVHYYNWVGIPVHGTVTKIN